jgi:hypothetical protein
MKNLSSVASVPAEIRIEDLPNTSLEHYPFADQVGLPQFSNTIYLEQRSYNLILLPVQYFLSRNCSQKPHLCKFVPPQFLLRIKFSKPYKKL